jgi:pyrroline-5-carboxylate reductase
VYSKKELYSMVASKKGLTLAALSDMNDNATLAHQVERGYQPVNNVEPQTANAERDL